MFEYVIIEKGLIPAMNLKLNSLAQEGWRVVGFAFDPGAGSYVALLEREKRKKEER